MEKQLFFIDISGHCNLKCASCARGNSPHIHNPTGLMDPSLLEQIVKKANHEYKVSQIHLYSWGESFLHPQLAQMVEITQSLGAQCFLSSNLNIAHNIEEVLNANPACLRVTVSGFTQPVYSRNHAGGNIEMVKDNLSRLSAAIRTKRLQTQVHVYYLRFIYNLHEERAMRDFARKLGFGFHPVWALLLPVEKALAFADPNSGEPALSANDSQVINDLALPLAKTLEVCRNYHSTCSLRDGQIALDVLGNVLLCCSVYDSSRFTIGPFLSSRPEDLRMLKEKHPFCAQCMKHGIHIYETRGAWEFDRLAADHIPRRYARRLSMRLERIKKTIFHRLIPSRYKGWCYNLYARLAKV